MVVWNAAERVRLYSEHVTKTLDLLPLHGKCDRLTAAAQQDRTGVCMCVVDLPTHISNSEGPSVLHILLALQVQTTIALVSCTAGVLR